MTMSVNSSLRKTPSSWPGLTRPSTSFFSRYNDVDARHKAGHDGFGLGVKS
jgi:hypothetical protein